MFETAIQYSEKPWNHFPKLCGKFITELAERLILTEHLQLQKVFQFSNIVDEAANVVGIQHLTQHDTVGVIELFVEAVYDVILTPLLKRLLEVHVHVSCQLVQCLLLNLPIVVVQKGIVSYRSDGVV